MLPMLTTASPRMIDMNTDRYSKALIGRSLPDGAEKLTVRWMNLLRTHAGRFLRINSQRIPGQDLGVWPKV